MKEAFFMETRFKKKSQIFDIVVTGVAIVLSVGIMLFAGQDKA